MHRERTYSSTNTAHPTASGMTAQDNDIAALPGRTIAEESIRRSVFLTKQIADARADSGSSHFPVVDVSPSDQSLSVLEQVARELDRG